MIALHALLARLESSRLLIEKQGRFDDNMTIDHLASDSRQVGPDGLFVAIRGAEADGHLFIDKAVKNGAIAIVCEAMPENHDVRFPGIAFVHVSNSRAALAEVSAAFYDDPSRELKLFGVTGTNGKTTTTFLIHHVLTRLGIRAGLVGTIEVRIGSEVLASELTTPDPLSIQKLIRRMRREGCTACVMEVSSHALDQERARALEFDAAVFTNLTRDHLDYHHTLEAYLAAKKRLFDGLSDRAVALYNTDDPAGERMVEHTRARVRSYGLGPHAEIRATIVTNGISGLELEIGGTVRRFGLVGRFNAYNLLAAYAAVTSLGFPETDVLDALADAPPVPGRFEQIPFDNGTTAVVDYAHTPDALENVLKTILETRAGRSRVWCVFGCGGDRDREKRPIMGRVAERYADHVIVTSDNPRTEDPQGILDDIRAGLDEPERASFIVDRRAAIESAVRRAAPGDIVLVAGKGHEPYQLVGTEKRPFDDREVVREAFSRLDTPAVDR